MCADIFAFLIAEGKVHISNDIRVVFYRKLKNKKKKNKDFFYYWFHTSYEHGHIFALPKNEVDGVRHFAKKGKKNPFSDNFRVETYMEPL